MTYRRARIAAARAAEFDERLMQLSLELIAEPRAGDTEYGMYLALFPTNRRVAPRQLGGSGNSPDNGGPS